MKDLAWQLDVWDAGDDADRLDRFGLRLRFDGGHSGGTEYVEYVLLMTREHAYQNGMLEHATHGDSSARVDVATLDPEIEVEVWGGMIERGKMAAYLRKVLAVMEGDR